MKRSALLSLHLHSVADRGIPNKERIAFIADGPCSLADYVVMYGLPAMNDGLAGVVPLQDKLFWLGHSGIRLNAGDWLLLYTGSGTDQVDQLPEEFGTGLLYSMHWGHTETLFYHPSFTPVLVRSQDFEFLETPPLLLPQPQGDGNAPLKFNPSLLIPPKLKLPGS